MMKIPFSPPDITEEEIQEVAEALRSGWITTGPKTKEFERKIADYCGVKRAVCLNSQTACAEMALRILGIGTGKRSDHLVVYLYGLRLCDLPCRSPSIPWWIPSRSLWKWIMMHWRKQSQSIQRP